VLIPLNTWMYISDFVIASVNARCEAVISSNGNYSLLCLELTAEIENWRKYVSSSYVYWTVHHLDI